jgi:ATP-dependent Lhr-like helicase
MDLAIEVPPSPLTAVMAHEVWQEYYDRLATLIGEHKDDARVREYTAPRGTRGAASADRLGDDVVTAHHGSLSKERRLDAEHRLKSGALKALVATASLELGIDIGHVDLVCQIGSPHRIATLLQRVGRSGHSIAGTPKGRLFPESLDDLVECAALLRSSRRGELDAIVTHDAPLDVLRSRSPPSRRAQGQRGRTVRADAERLALSRSARAPTSTRSSRWCRMDSRRREADGRRWCIAMR